MKVKIQLVNKLSFRDCRRIILDSQLAKEFGWTEKTAKHIAKDSKRAKVFAAKLGRKIVGFLVAQPDVLVGEYLKLIVVDANYRSHGVGSKLIAAFEASGFEKYKNIYLLVSSFNKKAQKLYRKLGYKKVGTLSNLIIAGKHEYLMRKTKGPVLKRR